MFTVTEKETGFIAFFCNQKLEHVQENIVSVHTFCCTNSCKNMTICFDFHGDCTQDADIFGFKFFSLKYDTIVVGSETQKSCQSLSKNCLLTTIWYDVNLHGG